MYSKGSLAKTLIALDNVSGTSGDETTVATVFKEQMEGLYDEYLEDPLGNQFFIKYGKNPEKKVMLTAHMDEIGFIINYIDDNGFARILPVGYHDDRMVVNQDLMFITSKGDNVYGVTGSKPAHIMNEEDHSKILKIEELFVDFGTENANETRALGIEIGDYGTYNREGYFLNGGKYYTGKSIDDRAGMAILVETLKRLKTMDIEPTICMVGTVQEEVGIRSGGPIVNRWKPELFLAIDVTITGGTPGVELSQCSQVMGGGVGIKYYDWDPILGQNGNNVPRKLTKHMVAIAEKYNIPYQREVMIGGGTDAWSAAMAHEGVLAGGICIPQRYMHTAVGTVNMEDMEHVTNFIVNYLNDYKSL